MRLLLTSSGITNKSIEKALLELLGKPFDKSNLTFVPTAANVEEGDKTWLVDDMNNFRKLNFVSFDIIDISAVSKDIWIPSFEKADILVFGGGNVHHLLTWIKRSGLVKLLPKFLENKVYVGISAGSMVTAKNFSLSTTNILYYEKNKSLKNTKGLGFVDFEIRPHLNSKWFPKVRLNYLEKLEKEAPNTFYAIDDGTAIKVIDKRVTIVSEGMWKKFN
ncbi:MAG: Type 1 glutamine amidotransferase-like domain-containing protein [Candidatus Levybacteria bacterium]|nr:Type 1 glutamine amidotransferase-like domain-containing protein [Candidatus Levybacteria bacterium]